MSVYLGDTEVGVTSTFRTYLELPDKPQINGVELVGNKTSEELGLVGNEELADYVKFTDIAQSNKAGLVKSAGARYGININPNNGNVTLSTPTEAEIDAKEFTKAVTLNRLDYVVKVGLTTNTITLTDEEKAAAQNWLSTFNKPKSTSGRRKIVVITPNSDGGTEHIMELGVAGGIATGYAIPVADSKGTVAVAEPTNNNHATTKNYVDNLFNGANKAVSFENYSEMISSLNSLANTSYSVGQNIMIVTLNVPDLWVSEIAEESVAYSYVSDDDFVADLNTNGSVQVGYFKLSALETQKVDLTDYAKVEDLDDYVKETDYATSTQAGVIKQGSGFYMSDGVLQLNSTLPTWTQDYLKQLMEGTSRVAVMAYAVPKLTKLALINPDSSPVEGVKANWTEEEKQQARITLGIDTLVGDINTTLETILGV